MLNNTSKIGRALIATLALGLTGSVGFAADSHYYVNDPLATTVAIADAAGEIAAIEADAFGSPLAAGEAPSRYTGKPYDADLGAFVFPFRNYRPEEGRWMSADPSGFPDGINGRAYASNPTYEIDPMGLVLLKSGSVKLSFVAPNFFGPNLDVFTEGYVEAIGNDNPAQTATISGGSYTITDSDNLDFWGATVPKVGGFGITLSLATDQLKLISSTPSNNGKTLTNTWSITATATFDHLIGVVVDRSTRTLTGYFSITHSVE